MVGGSNGGSGGSLGLISLRTPRSLSSSRGMQRRAAACARVRAGSSATSFAATSMRKAVQIFARYDEGMLCICGVIPFLPCIRTIFERWVTPWLATMDVDDTAGCRVNADGGRVIPARYCRDWGPLHSA